MQLSNLKSVLLGVGAAAAVIAVTGAASGSGIGGIFNLGKINTVNATSRLTGSTKHPMLSVTNNGTGTALSLQVANGKAPFSVNSPVQVAGLNASLLGGLAPTQFVQGGGQERSFGFTMSTATNSTKTLLSVPGFGTFNAQCGANGGEFAEVTFNPTHALSIFRTVIKSNPSVSVDNSFLTPNQNWLLVETGDIGANAVGERVIFRYATGHHLGFLITHIATVEIMAGFDPTTCDFDASAVIGPGTTGP